MLVSDFVCWVLRVPISSKGYSLICTAIKYIVETSDSIGLYDYLQSKYKDRNYSSIEKNIRDAKAKSFELISEENYSKVFHSLDKSSIKTKDFILYAAKYYAEEFIHENEEN